MSTSGWETKTVAENVPKELTVVGLISEEYVDKLKAEAAGMRRALESCRGYVSGVGNPHREAVEKALSGDAGKEMLEELEQLRVVVDSEHWKLLRLERDEARADLDREQKKNLQERKDLSELYAANMEVLKSQLETAQKELAELNNRDSEAKAECIRTMEKSIRELETAQRQVDRLLWASRRVRDGYPQEARGTYYEDLCTVIRVVESGLAGRDYVPRSEVSRAIEAERELAKAIRARGGK